MRNGVTAKYSPKCVCGQNSAPDAAVGSTAQSPDSLVVWGKEPHPRRGIIHSRRLDPTCCQR